MANPHAHLIVGSISLATARAAARAAKSARSAGPSTNTSDDEAQRYLGHFGPAAKRSGARKATARSLPFKKASAKKSGARKATKKHTGKAVKKSSSSRKR